MEHETLKIYALDQLFLATTAEDFIHSKGMSEEFESYFSIKKDNRDKEVKRILGLTKTL